MEILIFIVLIFAVFYFLMIRPQRKRQSEHRNLVEHLQKGDKVVTIGGLYGEIDSVDDMEVVLKVEDGSRLKFLRSSIMGKQQIEEADRSPLT